MDGEFHKKSNLDKLEKLLQKVSYGSKTSKGLSFFNDSILDAYNDKVITKKEMIMIMAFCQPKEKQ